MFVMDATCGADRQICLRVYHLKIVNAVCKIWCSHADPSEGVSVDEKHTQGADTLMSAIFLTEAQCMPHSITRMPLTRMPG